MNHGNEETSLIRLTPGCGDKMVAELGEAHDEVDRRALKVGGDLEARVLPPGSILKNDYFANSWACNIKYFWPCN